MIWQMTPKNVNTFFFPVWVNFWTAALTKRKQPNMLADRYKQALFTFNIDT